MIYLDTNGGEMSDKNLAIAFLLVTLCVAVLATIIFPTVPGLP